MSRDDDEQAFEAAAQMTPPSPQAAHPQAAQPGAAPAARPGGLAARAAARAPQAGPDFAAPDRPGFHPIDSARIFAGLNPPQRAAVEALDGPVLVLAGAGTGKTRVLTARIAHLLNSRRALPNEILAVTFTNKAAREMKFRLGRLLGDTAEGMPWLGTFHGLCLRMLRRNAELVGLKSDFTILDADDQLRLMRQLIQAANIDDKRWPSRQLAGLIDGWKNRALRPEKVPAEETAAFGHRGTELYAAYQARLLALNAVDFGDLLLHMVTVFQNHPDVLRRYQSWLRYILVDEYQDTNTAQYLWLRLLAQGHSNICCVGDDDQSIYGWRGAEVRHILQFERHFPGAQVIRLEQNYRSTQHILAAAGSVIDRNDGRLGKTLWTDRPGGDKLRLIGHWDGEEEARWIGEDIEALQRGGRAGRDPIGLNAQVILVRASHQMRAFEDRFLTIGLPYRVVGGPRFYERQEIRDAMAYFRLVTSPGDDLAFERIVNLPRRGLGDKAVQTIHRLAREADVSLLQGARAALAQAAITGKGAAGLRRFISEIDHWHQAWRDLGPGAQALGPDDDADDRVIEEFIPSPAPGPQGGHAGAGHVRLAEEILDGSGYTAMWQNEKTPDAEGRLENLKELIKALEQFDSLQGFLDHVALIMENDSTDAAEKVTIMTLHAAKGLEFPVVYLPGWEEGLFPSQRALDETGLRGLEEERRLAYVGITRAESLCTISFAGNRRVFGRWQSQLPSRFIDELPEDHVDVLTPPGLYGGGYGAAAGPGGAGGWGGSGGMGGAQRAARQAEEDAAELQGIALRASRADVYNSPGWQRMQGRAGNNSAGQAGNLLTGGQARHAAPRAAAARKIVIDHEPVPFDAGDRVFHPKFGYGAVLAVEGDKLRIAFDKAGEKRLMAGYVLPADAADDSQDVPF